MEYFFIQKAQYLLVEVMMMLLLLGQGLLLFAKKTENEKTFYRFAVEHSTEIFSAKKEHSRVLAYFKGEY